LIINATKYAILLLAFMGALSGCVAATYNISDIDWNAIEPAKVPFSRGCIPEYEIVWGEVAALEMQSSYRFNGKLTENIKVHLRQVLQSVSEGIAERSRDRSCGSKVMLHVTNAKHFAQLSMETGNVYAKARIQLMVKAICSESNRQVLGTLKHSSPAVLIGFSPGHADIERGLAKATTYAAIGVLQDLSEKCNMPSSSWGGQK
jgi:hypothetical protein